MPKERTEQKAARLLREGRVKAVTFYVVEGDTGTYKVNIREHGLTCTCPSRRDCAHKMAVRAKLAEERS